MKSQSVTIQMKAIEQYFPVVLFIMLFKVVLTFESEDKILLCDTYNLNESLIFRTTFSWCCLWCCFQYFSFQNKIGIFS